VTLPAPPEAAATEPWPGEPFLEMLAAERGAALNTLEAYRRDLTDYLGVLAGQGVVPAKAEPATVRAYLSDLETRGLSAASAAFTGSSMRRVLRRAIPPWRSPARAGGGPCPRS